MLVPLMTLRSWLFLTLATGLAACEAPTAPGERDQLTQARARWQALGSSSYTYELTQGCFCVLAGRAILVTVENGTVANAEYVGTGDAVEHTLIGYLPSIPDLFDLIEDALNANAVSFAATYDELYGYPTRIEIDYSATAIDDERVILARNLALKGALSPRP
jgi:hypothetical protein